MIKQANTTIAKGLSVSEISCGRGFSHARVIDVRCCGNKARPIEDEVLKRLRNHFVEYLQMPISFTNAGPCQEVHLCETILESDADTLVISDDLTQLAALFAIYAIDFKSNSFYIVETGKGEVVKPMPDNGEMEDEASAVAKFGTFGG